MSKANKICLDLSVSKPYTWLMSTTVRAVRHLPHLGRLGLDRVGPGWFTSIMGTGILAITATISPIPIPFGQAIGVTLWSVDAVLFALFTLLWAIGNIRAPKALLETLRDPVKAQVLGAPPMACFTIAVGFLKIGESFLPLEFCVAAAQTLFIAGVIGSIASAFAVPYLMFTHHEIKAEKMYGSWLLPVVPPIVASVPAALLSPTWPEAIRGDMLGLAYALLGIGVILAAIIVVIFYSRLTIHKVPEGALVTTMWLVVGPLGQSIAGMIALGNAARAVWPEFGHGLAIAGLAYGVLVWGFAMYWLAMAIAMTIRAKSKHLPFNLSWWAFTFPVGVLTAGTDALYLQTHAHIFGIVSLALLALLAAMWMLVATKTVRGAAREALSQIEIVRRPRPAPLSDAA
ncbi:MAG: TDT family transporter [Vulcanimicrobiaceae bacterium]